MASTYRESLNRYLAQLEVVGDVVYDVGGAQESLPKRVKRFEVGEYTIFDLEKPHRGSTPAVVLDLNYVPSLGEWAGKADQVYCFEVFEYIFNPVLAMHTLASLLKPGGVLIASFPFLYPIHEPIEDDALRYTENGIRKIAARAGLTVDEVHYRRAETTGWQSFVSMERMRPSGKAQHNILGYIVEFHK